MNIVLLCAGTSSRMGKTNKMLIPFGESTIVANSAMQALKYLEKTDESSRLIVVTGYKHFATEKALQCCRDFVASTSGRISLIIVHNKDYKLGQFTSVQTGVAQVPEDESFFISLADMPKITDAHYEKLSSKLDGFDAARFVCNTTPGHPVLLSASIKNKILKAQKNNKVSSILKTMKVNSIETSDHSWICDIDTEDDLKCLN